jgi:V/A-type H+-transporting ATPase subunit E
MSLENIIQEIDNRKKEEINKIIDEYTKKTNALQLQKEKKINEIKELYQKKKTEDGLLIEKREIDTAEFEGKKTVRDRVAELIDINVNKSVTILEDLKNTEEYREILNKMVQSSKKLLGNDCTIRVNPDDAHLILDNSVKIVENNVDKYGGIIAESEDKEVDLTISSIIKNLRERIAMELSNIVEDH